jgi:RNA polymerase sigma-70 factor (ECF subfamily)
MPSEGEGQHIDDVTLLRGVATGDPAAFRALFDRHAAALLRFATTLSHDRAIAEDAVQEAFTALWQHADGFRSDSSPRSWLFTITRNAVHRRYRRRADRPSAHDSLDSLDSLGGAAGWGDPSLLRSLEERIADDERVRRALATLEDDDRAVLSLVDVEGLSNDEAAAALSITVSALKSRLHRARLRFVASLRTEDPS